MNKSDKSEANEFFSLLDATYDVIGVGAAKIISPAAKAMFYEDLERYPLDLIRASLSAHRTDPDRGKFTPKPADIVYQIERRRKNGWLDPDEAWSQVPKIEGQPGLLNDVSAQALAVAAPLLAEGDETAARMAFKACYKRLVECAKLERRGPEYWLSPGGTREEMQAVAQEAVRQGLLSTTAFVEIRALPAPTKSGLDRLKAALLTLKLGSPK